jgi:23S rRNA (uridine2552-2'-O)-methyltransferase
VPQALPTGNPCSLGELLYTICVPPRYEPKDAVHRAAVEAGYRSRAALKLRELDGKFKLLAPGLRVLDLGCWPGGWIQVAAGAVGARGRVFGVDSRPLDDLRLPNVSLIVADLLAATTLDTVGATIDGKVDLVLSDLAPKLSGVRDADRARHLALCERVMTYCDRFLKTGGRCVIKVFSDSESEVTAMLRARFARAVKHRPSTTRKGSSELYAVGTGYAPPNRGA